MKTLLILTLGAAVLAGCMSLPKVQDTFDDGAPKFQTSTGEVTPLPYENAITKKPTNLPFTNPDTKEPTAESATDGKPNVPNPKTKAVMVPDATPIHETIDQAEIIATSAGAGAVAGIGAQVAHWLVGMFIGKRREKPKAAKA